MTRHRRSPAFEQLETKSLLAADSCEHALEEMPDAAELSLLSPQLTDGESFGGPISFQVASSISESQSSSSEDDEEEEDEQDSETDDDDESEEESDEDEEEEADDDEDESEDETDDDEDEDDETDDEDEDESDEDESEDDDSDDDESDDDESDDDDSDDDETVITANLTGTGTGTAEFETETEDGGTERELTIEVTGTTPGTHQVKVNSTVVGEIVVGSDGRGTLELSSDPDDDEAQLPDSVTITGGTTVMVGSVLMGTFPTTQAPVAAATSESSALAVESLFSAEVAESGASESLSKVRTASSRAVVVDAEVADLLLTMIGLPSHEEPASTEFVGRSDNRDVSPESQVTIDDAAFGEEDELPAGA
jgi:hypothetical protein